MKKINALLWLMRAHEAVRKLPADADINSIGVTLYGDGNKINIFLRDETEIKNVVSREVIKYADCNRGRVEVSDSSGVDYWWGCEFNDE